MIKVVVLSLRSATERRDLIERQLADLKVEFRFFDAIELSDNYKNSSEIYSDDVVKKNLGFSMTRSEVSCALGHIKIYSEYCMSCDGLVILEDDVLVSEKFRDFLSALNDFSSYNSVKDHFFMLGGQELLDGGREAVFGRRARLRFGRFSVHKAFFSNYKIKGTFGYFIGANCMRRASEKMLPIIGRADDWVNFIDLDVFPGVSVVSPTVVMHPPITKNQSSIFDNSLMGRGGDFSLHGFRWRIALAARLLFSIFY